MCFVACAALPVLCGQGLCRTPCAVWAGAVPHSLCCAVWAGAVPAGLYLPRGSTCSCLPARVQGIESVAEMQRILDSTRSKMRLLVASVRDTSELSTLAAQVRWRGGPSGFITGERGGEGLPVSFIHSFIHSFACILLSFHIW